MEIVQDEFIKNKINMSDGGINNFVIDILNTVYSTGGDFSKETLKRYIGTYIEEKFYEKYL